MKETIECPYCDGKAKLQKESKDLTYRKEEFKVVAHFYKCGKCGEEFTTTETDTITLVQAHNQYREKYGIPFPEEICAIREKYDLSAAKMSEILGLGPNGYSNYEKGEVPTTAIGNLISSAANPKVFNEMLEKAKNYIPDSTFEKTKSKIDYLIASRKKIPAFYNCPINLHENPSSLTGFKKPNSERLANVLRAFILNCEKSFNDRLKLNKLLFYADFANYKKSGFSITGLSYRAIQYGPVPTHYDNIYTFFENENILISEWSRENNNSAREIFVTENDYDKKLFNSTEWETIETIIEKFKTIPSWDLVDLSHDEKGWIELHDAKDVISYQTYAFDLKGV